MTWVSAWGPTEMGARSPVLRSKARKKKRGEHYFCRLWQEQITIIQNDQDLA